MLSCVLRSCLFQVSVGSCPCMLNLCSCVVGGQCFTARACMFNRLAWRVVCTVNFDPRCLRAFAGFLELRGLAC